MRLSSPQAVFFAVFCVWGVCCLGGCVDSIDLGTFTKDKDVLDIIDKGAGTVNKTLDSDPGLSVGNRKITGLNPEKYYMVEEWDEDGTSVSVQFVSASGERSASVANIGMVSGGEITGLTNLYNYRVTSAKALPGSLSYAVLDPPGSGTKTVADGGITLNCLADGTFLMYTLTPPSFPPYDTAEIPVAPAGFASLVRRSAKGDIMTFVGKDTVTDYVFVGNVDGVKLFNYFYALRVTAVTGPITPPPPPPPLGPGTLTVNVAISFSKDTKFNFTYTGATTFNQASPSNITITIAAAATTFPGATFNWYYAGNSSTTPLGTGAAYTVPFATNNDYLLPGEHVFYVEAVISGVARYSDEVKFTVTLSP